MATNGTYPEHSRAKVNRKKQRGVYDYATIHEVLSSAPIMHVGFAPSPTDPFPTVLPMIGAVANYATRNDSEPSSGPQDVYLHGYVTARLIQLAGHAANLDDDGLPVSICATSIDGLVMALTPFNHSMNYRSAVVHGYAKPVTDPDEKMWAMEQVTEVVCRGRWKESRTPPDKGELQSTGILRITIASASAKQHVGMPGDDRKDAQNSALRERIWTGVVPSYFSFGEPVPAPENKIPVPAYLSDYIKGHNERNERIAREAVYKKE